MKRINTTVAAVKAADANTTTNTNTNMKAKTNTKAKHTDTTLTPSDVKATTCPCPLGCPEPKRGFGRMVWRIVCRLVEAVIGAIRSGGLMTVIAGAVSVAAICIMLTGCDDASGLMTAAVLVPGVLGGKHVAGGAVTTAEVREAAPDLLVNEIDRRIVKIRPMATPIDQISRFGGSRPSGSMIVDYYSVDTKPVSTTVAEAVTAGTDDSYEEGYHVESVIRVRDKTFFSETETVLVPAVKGKHDGAADQLVLYVCGVESHAEGRYRVIALNNCNDRGVYLVPAIPAGTKVVRMGRAATELAVQTEQFEPLPRKDRNYCQIFK